MGRLFARLVLQDSWTVSRSQVEIVRAHIELFETLRQQPRKAAIPGLVERRRVRQRIEPEGAAATGRASSRKACRWRCSSAILLSLSRINIGMLW